VHYPDAPVDDLAAQIYSIERFGDGLLFYKSPNRFPSNFAYDPQNAQASAALDHMADVLKDATSEGGLVQYADILTRHRSRAEARATLEKLASLGANSRQYYQMAGGLAQQDKRLEDAAALFTVALAKFPHDPQFTCMLAAAYTGLRQEEKAEAALRAAFAMNPRARAVIAALSRHLIRTAQYAEARTLVESTITLFPQHLRPSRHLMLGQIMRELGDLGAAEQALAVAYDAAPQDALICQEYSKVMRDKNDPVKAVDYAAQALSLAPSNPRIQAYHATLET
jgi:tetratricopeptide (TPR) repeat protein